MLLGNSVLNGIGSLQYTGTSILLSQPETGALITEYSLQGSVNRPIGSLRQTGHEDDREVHLALNSGIPLVDPSGGFFFVFQAGEPAFRKYDRDGTLIFERRIAGSRDRSGRRQAADDVAEAEDERRRTPAGAGPPSARRPSTPAAGSGSLSSCRTPTCTMPTATRSAQSSSAAPASSRRTACFSEGRAVCS